MEKKRWIVILARPLRDIAIFPVSRATYLSIGAQGEIHEGVHYPAFPPITLNYPYEINELADAIMQGISLWEVHDCFEDGQGNKKTFEEVFYDIKGFKNASKGIRLIYVYTDTASFDNTVDVSLPTKSGYAYLGIDETTLKSGATWLDFADIVDRYANMDLEELKSFKLYKKKLNI